MKIKFLEDRAIPAAAAIEPATLVRKGEVVAWPEAEARRWINRGAAAAVTARRKPKAPARGGKAKG